MSDEKIIREITNEISKISTQFKTEMPHIKTEIKDLKESQILMGQNMNIKFVELQDKMDRMNTGFYSHCNNKQKSIQDQINKIEKKQTYYTAIISFIVGIFVFFKESFLDLLNKLVMK